MRERLDAPIAIPPDQPPTPEEIARRTRIMQESFALREKIGPIGVPVAELIRQVREGAEPGG